MRLPLPTPLSLLNCHVWAAWIDEDKIMFVHVLANANPLGLLNFHVWDAHGQHKSGKGLMMRTKFFFVNVFANANPPQPGEFECDLRDIDGAIHF